MFKSKTTAAAFCGGILVASICAALFWGKSEQNQVFAEPQPKADAFEYGVLVDDANGAFAFTSKDEDVNGSSYDEIAKKMKVKMIKDNAPRLSIYNHLGANGWELCGTHSELMKSSVGFGITGYSTTNRYIFKRKLR